MNGAPRLRDYLGHILFLSKDNELVQDAVIRNFEIIGEASHNIESRHREFLAAHPNLPLLDAYDMRNALAHGYFKVDLEVVWKTAQEDLPELHQHICEILKQLP